MYLKYYFTSGVLIAQSIERASPASYSYLNTFLTIYPNVVINCYV